MLKLVDRLCLIEFRYVRIFDGFLDHLQQRALALFARVGADDGWWYAGPDLHSLGGAFFCHLEFFAGRLFEADRLVVHHVGVGLHAFEDDVRIEGHVAIEQRLADHVGCQRPGLFDHFDCFASARQFRPRVHLGLNSREEVGDVFGKHVRMEGRLLRHPDLLPKRSVIGDHRLAEDWLQPVEIFHIAVVLVDQHMLDHLRVRQHDDTLIGHVDGNDRTIAVRHRHQGTHRVLRIAF